MNTTNETELELAPPPQIYLIMDLSLTETPLDDIKTIAKEINTSEFAPLSSLLIKQNDPKSLCSKELVKDIQAENIAVLIEDNVPLAKSLNADGIHLSDDDEDIFKAAIETLSEDVIIGIKAKQSRHKAMIFAEEGCSYIAIDLFDQDNHQRELEEFERPPEINWWVSLFSTPCVAWDISSTEQAIEATKQGADFLGLAPEFWQQGENSAKIIDECVKTTSAIERYLPAL